MWRDVAHTPLIPIVLMLLVMPHHVDLVLMNKEPQLVASPSFGPHHSRSLYHHSEDPHLKSPVGGETPETPTGQQL